MKESLSADKKNPQDISAKTKFWNTSYRSLLISDSLRGAAWASYLKLQHSPLHIQELLTLFAFPQHLNIFYNIKWFNCMLCILLIVWFSPLGCKPHQSSDFCLSWSLMYPSARYMMGKCLIDIYWKMCMYVFVIHVNTKSQTILKTHNMQMPRKRSISTLMELLIVWF